MSGTWASTVVQHIRTLVEGRKPNTQTDECLLEQFISQRDESAFSTIVQRHGPMTMGVCLRILRDQHLAEDAFQATFLVLALKARGIRKRRSVASWLYGVANRLARKLKEETYRSKRPDVREHGQPLRDSPMEADGREACELLDEELARLPDKYRLPLLLCYFEGRTQEEAADELGCSAGKVKGLLHRGRERLRFRLIRRGVTLSAAASAAMLSNPALSATVPPLLASSTVQAALHLISGQSLAACGASAAVANLTKGGLIMGAHKMILGFTFVLVTVSLGVGAAIWANAGNDSVRSEGRSDVASSNVPLPAKTDAIAETNLPAILQTSKPAKADELEFQIVSSVIWPMPGQAGSSPVQFQLRVTNRGNKDVRFLPVVGKPILQSADGNELPAKMSGQDHVRVLPKPVTIEAGKTITVKGGAQLGTYDKKSALGWEDETGMVWSVGVKSGKYLLSLQYKTQELGHDAQSVAQTGSWLGAVRTEAVPVEIVDLTAFEPAVTNGLEVVALADSTWRVPPANDPQGGKQTRVCLGFRIASVDKPRHQPWIIPTIAKVSIQSADGMELPVKKMAATVPVAEPQLMVLRPKENYTAANPAMLFRAGKTLTLAWADGAGNVWQVENLRPGKHTVRYVVEAGKGSQERPISWLGQLPTATFAIEIKE